MKLLAYIALFSGASAIQRFHINEMQVGETNLESRQAREERMMRPAPRNFDAAVNSNFENDENNEVVLMRIPPNSNFMQTMPDAEYDDDIEAEGSHGMEAKHGEEYVNGMMGNETLKTEGKAMIGGSYIDLVQNKKSNPQDPNALGNRKISVSGDMVSGMNGDEKINGPAVVTGTNVTYSQGAAKSTNQ